MFRNTHMFVVVALTVATAACAKPPPAQVDAVNAALNNATGAGASEYAPEAYSAARDAQAKLDAELKAQEGKFAPNEASRPRMLLRRRVSRHPQSAT